MIVFCQPILAGCLCTTKTLLTSSNPADYISLTRFDLTLLANWMMTMRRQNPSLKRTSRDNPESEFRPLADQWREETGALSSVSQTTMHPAYQRIIDMGERVIPWILQELEERPHHWFRALHCITGENPVPPEAAANVQLMTEAWLNWGMEGGFWSSMVMGPNRESLFSNLVQNEYRVTSNETPEYNCIAWAAGDSSR